MTSICIISDSSFMRTLIRKRLSNHAHIKILGDSQNAPAVSIEMLHKAKCNLVLVDIDVPTIANLECVRQIVQQVPSMKVIVLMNLSIGGADIALKALEYGAIDFIHKETSLIEMDIHAFENALVAKIAQWGDHSASSTNVQREVISQINKKEMQNAPSEALLRPVNIPLKPIKPIQLVLIGISTGGPLTILSVLNQLRGMKKRIRCPIIIAQHMPEAFTKSLSIHLRTETALNVIEGSHALPLEPGMIVIARGGTDSKVQLISGAKLMLVEKIDPAYVIHPSVDALFMSASQMKCETLGIVMTGMGTDGLAGSKALHAQGMKIIAQDPKSCIVNSMPSAVIDAKVATHIFTPEKIGELIESWCKE